ncbi:MAG: hypothetical protein ACYTXI_23030 [Nostoc sp.]
MALRKAETLVDAALSNPATQGDAARTLLAENQDCGVEPRDCHGGAFSAAPVAQNLTNLEEQHSRMALR